jgi:hypothetical protein
MRTRLIAACSTLTLLVALGLYARLQAQTAQMARHEPHMSAALGHLQQARAELEKAVPNKGGHRERAMELVDKAIQQVQEGEVYYEQHGER